MLVMPDRSSRPACVTAEGGAILHLRIDHHSDMMAEEG